MLVMHECWHAFEVMIMSTAASLCKDTQCKDILNVRTMQLGTNHWILTAVAPLRKDNSISGQLSWKPKQSLLRELTVQLSGSSNVLQATQMMALYDSIELHNSNRATRRGAYVYRSIKDRGCAPYQLPCYA